VKIANETTSYAQMGMAALLPGMQHMLELMQAQLDDFRRQLQGLQNPVRKRGRPRKQAAEPSKFGWSDDPEERSREMRRRMAKWGKNKPSESELSKQRKRQWAALSPAKRKARLAAMQAGKNKKQPVAGMAVAS
jgi:hypothetical protein